MSKKIGWFALAFAAVFLAGFVPQYCSRVSVESELKDAVRKNQEAQLRDLVSLAYIQAVQKNYGLAAQTSTEFFSRLAHTAAETPVDNPARQSFDEILRSRDKITAGLAKGDPGVLGDLQAAFQKTRAATIGK
jgi:hypothetical protein